MKINTDKQQINKLLKRSVDRVYPEKSELSRMLESGERLRIYAGVDPTADFLHLGHAINYRMMREFWELGHQVIVLVGDFTAMIGDPTDKSATRTRLTREEIENNFSAYKEQISKILPLDDKANPVEFRFNSEWLSDLDFSAVVDLASNFTVQQMIERDTFKRRIEAEKPLYVHEFFYPLMQGYDSVALEADVEIGGTDQTFNMLAGRTLRKRIQDAEKFVVTHPLLENPETGEILMSKSAGTGVRLDDNPTDMYAKVMAIPDAGIALVMRHCTDISLDEVEKVEGMLEAENKKGKEVRDAKMRLAHEVVATYHSKTNADEAEKDFKNTFQKGGTPDEVTEVTVEEDSTLMDAVVSNGLAPSNSQFRRLIEQGAVTDMNTGKKIDDPHAQALSTTYKIGKHRFIKILTT